MEGLSQQMGQGYAQVLPAGDDNLKNVIAWQEKAMTMDAAAKKKKDDDEKETKKELGKVMTKLPTDLYEKHNPEFDEKKKEFFDYTYQNIDKLEMGTPERMEWEKKANDLTVFANQSKNFRETLEALKKDQGKLSDESLEYLEKAKGGYDDQGNPILSVDPQQLYGRPDYSKVYSSPNVRAIIAPNKTEVPGSPSPTSVRGVYEVQNTLTEEVTQDQIDQAAKYGWLNMNEAEKVITIKDVAHKMKKGSEETKPYESLLVTTKDANGNDIIDYSEAAEKYVQDKFLATNKPKKITKRKKQFVYDQSIKRGSGAEEKSPAETEVVTEEENIPVVSVEKGGMKGYQWHNATDKNGKTIKILWNPATRSYYKPKSPGVLAQIGITEDPKEWEEIPESEFDDYKTVEPVVVSGEKTKEAVYYNKPQLATKLHKFSVPYYVSQDGAVNDTKQAQGIMGTPKEGKIAWVTKDGKQYDVKPGTGEAELKFMVTVADKNGKLLTFPADQKHIDEIEGQYEGLKFQLWDDYLEMKRSGATPAARKQSTPAKQTAPAKPNGGSREYYINKYKRKN